MLDLRNSSDPDVLTAAAVLQIFDEHARTVGVPYVVIGAPARNLLAAAHVGLPPDRATRDIDVAVAVDGWELFTRLTRRLTRRGRSADAFMVAGVAVDVVPYGGVVSDDGMLDWPDDTRMSLLGLAEVAAGARAVRLPGGLSVRIPTVAGLIALKITAWQERRLETRREACLRALRDGLAGQA